MHYGEFHFLRLCNKGVTTPLGMSNNDVYEIIGRVLTECNSRSDEEALKAWLDQSNENRQVYEILKNNWLNAPAHSYSILGSEEVKASIWERVSRKNPKKVLGVKWTTLYKVAATISIFIVTIFLGYHFSVQEIHSEPEIAIINKENNAGRKSIIYVGDGSIVYLNAESRLTYPEVFPDTARILHLEGEAYFEVARDDQKPFTVISQNVAVVALGTSFNVLAYKEMEEVKISLADGKIKVQPVHELGSSSHEDQYLLEPGQEISYNSANNRFSDPVNFNRKRVLGWKEGILSFEKAGLPTIIKQLERWYGVEIKVTNKNVPNVSYTGEFHNQSLRNVLESISFVQNFDFEINGNNVIIKFSKI